MNILKRELLHYTLIKINYIQTSALLNTIQLEVDKIACHFVMTEMNHYSKKKCH